MIHKYMHIYHTYIRTYVRPHVVCVKIYQRKVGWWAFIRKWKRKENKREKKQQIPEHAAPSTLQKLS